VSGIAIALTDIEQGEELTCDISKRTTPEHFEFLESLNNN
jgi:hypothetical protein